MNAKNVRSVRKAFSAFLALSLLFGSVPNVKASSHREAPNITKTPKVDGTDFYMFRSYEPGRADYVTILADYQPFQQPFGGPNYYSLDPAALYEIHIDNNGDSKEDMTFQFRFKNNLTDIKLDIGGKKNSIPLLYAGQVKAGDDAALNVKETYTMNVVRGDRRGGSSRSCTSSRKSEFVKPLDYVGTKTLPDYKAYADQYKYNVTIPGCAGTGRVFVGQRADPFVVNVGEAFDLINLSPTGARDAKSNDLAGRNITTIALEVPISCLIRDAKHPIIAGWQTASLPQNRRLNPTPSYNRPDDQSGAFTQVSRLANPLVNELVIGLPDKDGFNASKPANDAQFLSYVTNPTFPAIIEKLYGTKAPATPRTDLVGVFLTGVKGVNADGGASELMRLNTAVPPTPRGSQNNLGAAGCFDPGPVPNLKKAGCDPAGYPNGRRPGDDVVDITLRVAMGALLPTAKAPSGAVPFTDQAIVNDGMYANAWPYVNGPTPGAPQATRLANEQTNQPAP